MNSIIRDIRRSGIPGGTAVLWIGILCCLVLASSCRRESAAPAEPAGQVSDSRAQPQPSTPTPEPTATPLPEPIVVMTDGGVHVEIEKPGTGPRLRPGQTALIHYRLTLTEGEEIDSTYDHDSPMRVHVGQGRLIRGLDEGLLALGVGSRARLIVPPQMGMGEEGLRDTSTGEVIVPGNAVLVFDVEVFGLVEEEE